MLPDNVLSTVAVPSTFEPPRNRFKEDLLDYELGGVALNDATQGLRVKVWRGQYIDGAIVLDAPGVVPTEVFVAADISEFQFTFDQNMQPFVTYIQDGQARYRWYDATIPDFVIHDLPVGAITPRCALDDKRRTQGAVSDIILAYALADTLYMRVQRDRYGTDYVLAAALAGAELEQVGMNNLGRFQFRLKGGPSQTPSPIAIERILAMLCARAGIEDFDASDHETNFIDGYAISRETTARGAIEPLRMAGLFDAVESNGVLKFPARGKAAVATIDEDEFGVVEEGQEIPPAVTTRKLQDYELPRQIRIRYPSLDRNYEIGEQLSPTRFGTVGVNDVSVELPVVVSDSRATEIAETTFREAWASRWSHEFALGSSRFELEPADVVLLPVDGRLIRTRISTFDDAALAVRRATALRDDDGAYVSIAQSASPSRPPTVVQQLGETEALLLDLPALLEAHDDAGLYLAGRRAGTGTTWQGARLHRSVDNGITYAQVAGMAGQATIGTVVSAPGAGDAYTWDDAGEFVIDVLSGTLESRTDQAVLAGANAAAVGAHGRWHIFQFAIQALVSEGRYRLTRLLLGRRGTEHLIDTVQPGDTFVLVSGPGIYRAPLQNSEIGVSRLYRAVTNGAQFSTGSDFAFTGSGEALGPFAPVHVRGSRDGSSNLTITWLRRDRLAQTLRSGVTLPLSESAESYEVDVLDGSDQVLRTLVSATTSVNYSAADQTTDFGSPQTAVKVRIYQLSAVVGRGTPAEATI